MSVSLINPNQVRHYGHKLCDDVTNTGQRFGIKVDDETFIPFQMEGTTVYFKTHVPLQWEMENSKIFVMTDDDTWDPATVRIARVGSGPICEAEAQARVRLRSLTRSNVGPASKLEGQILSNVSNVYNDDAFIQRIVGAINVATHVTTKDQVRNVNQISFIGTKDRHSQVTAEEVARKFRCGIEIAKQTLKTTTQRGVRHAIHPLH
jgi:hypothetical protein